MASNPLSPRPSTSPSWWIYVLRLFFVEGGGGGLRWGCGEAHMDKHWHRVALKTKKAQLLLQFPLPICHMTYGPLLACWISQSVSQSVGQPVSQSKTEDWDWCSVPCMASKTMNSSMLADPQQLWCCRDLIIVFLSSVPQRAWRCIANLRMPQYKSVTHPKQTQTKWDKLKQFLFS